MTDTSDAILVTAVIPMRNEERHIGACLDTVRANVLPDGVLEILVIDGESEDRSREVVMAHAAADPRVRLLANPARLQSAAFNLGVSAARGRFLVRMDAHTLYAPDYIGESIRLLEQTGASNVGGPARAAGTGPISAAIAVAVSSPFAAGDSKYRYATQPAWVDSVFNGAWETETLRKLGGMRTDLAVNEDYEMNVRLRKMGGRVYLSPTIRSTYFVRGSLPQLARQYGRYGFWKVRTLRDHPDSLKWRQLVAPAFVLSIVLAPLMVAAIGPLGASHLVVYLAANIGASIVVASRTSWRHLPLLPAIYLVVHLSWGIGFWMGIAGWGRRETLGAR